MGQFARLSCPTIMIAVSEAIVRIELTDRLTAIGWRSLITAAIGGRP